MSDCIIVTVFNKGDLRLVESFTGDSFDTAMVKFTLETRDGKPTMYESVVVPVACLFDMAMLLRMSIRKTALLYELQIQEMTEKFKIKKECNHGTKENQAK